MRLSKLKYLLMLLLLLNVCCRYEPSHQVSAIGNSGSLANNSSSKVAAPVSSHTQDSSIRAVNFHNFTYHWYPRWEYMLSEAKDFTLQDGKLEVETPSNSNEPHVFELLNIQYSDVAKDGAEEAIITIKMSVMGNAKPYVVFVYTLTDGELKMLWAHETGDRADEGLRNVYVTDDHLLAIEQYNADKIMSNDGEVTKLGMCCPKTFTRTFYKWHKNQFQKFREETHPNNYKDARVIIGSTTASD